jgi:hypothetical protein
MQFQIELEDWTLDRWRKIPERAKKMLRGFLVESGVYVENTKTPLATKFDSIAKSQAYHNWSEEEVQHAIETGFFKKKSKEFFQSIQRLPPLETTTTTTVPKATVPPATVPEATVPPATVPTVTVPPATVPLAPGFSTIFHRPTMEPGSHNGMLDLLPIPLHAVPYVDPSTWGYTILDNVEKPTVLQMGTVIYFLVECWRSSKTAGLDLWSEFQIEFDEWTVERWQLVSDRTRRHLRGFLSARGIFIDKSKTPLAAKLDAIAKNPFRWWTIQEINAARDSGRFEFDDPEFLQSIQAPPPLKIIDGRIVRG